MLLELLTLPQQNAQPFQLWRAARLNSRICLAAARGSGCF